MKTACVAQSTPAQVPDVVLRVAPLLLAIRLVLCVPRALSLPSVRLQGCAPWRVVAPRRCWWLTCERPSAFSFRRNCVGYHRQRACGLFRRQGFCRHPRRVYETLCARRGLFHVSGAGLSFQESILRYYEDKYGIPIHRIPHFELSQWLRYGLFRPFDFDCPIVSVKEIYGYMRANTDIWWVAAGERISDSVWRRAMIKHSGTIDQKRGRFSLSLSGAGQTYRLTFGSTNCVWVLNRRNWNFPFGR